MSFAEEMESAVSRLAAEIGPSVVGIGQRWGLGSGIVVAPGQVLTNAHNVRGEDISVTFADGRTEKAQPKAADYDRDLAVIAVDTGQARPLDA
ncbi:MAG TPA: serine protease, partial [Actinomycetota bacterium]